MINYKQFCKTTSTGMLVCNNDKHLSIIWANDSAYTILGHTKENLESTFNNTFVDVFLDGYKIPDVNCLQNQTRSDYVQESRVQKMDGSIVWIRNTLYYDATANLFYATLMDITDIYYSTDLSYSLDSHQIMMLLSKNISDSPDRYIYCYDVETHQLLFVNQPMLNLLGLSSESQWKNKPCYEVIYGKNKPDILDGDSKLREDKFLNWDLYNPRFKLIFSTKSKIVYLNGRKCRLDICTDQNVQNQLNNNLTHRLFMEKTISECAHILNRNLDQTESINQLLLVVRSYYQSDRACIFQLNQDNESFSCSYQNLKSDRDKNKNQLTEIPPETQLQLIKEFEETDHSCINIVLKESIKPEYAVLKNYAINTLVVSPIKLNEKAIIGFICVENAHITYKLTDLLPFVANLLSNYFEKNELIRMLNQQATTDGMTGLFNHTATIEKITHSLQYDNLKSAALFIIDIDHFKSINDNLGHDMGDLVIKDLAKLLTRTFRQSDIVGRIGGDEFLVFFSEFKNLQIVKEKAKILNQSFDKIYTKDTVVLPVSISIGVALYSETTNNYESLFKNADLALYSVKKSKKNNYSIFDFPIS